MLSQWRGYGKNGGIAIGFNFTYKEEEYLGRKSVLPHSFLDRDYYENTEKDDNKFLPQEGEWIHLFQVIYDPKEQRRILDDIICLGSEAVEYYINTRKPSDAIKEIQNISQNIINTIEYFLPLFKIVVSKKKMKLDIYGEMMEKEKYTLEKETELFSPIYAVCLEI